MVDDNKSRFLIQVLTTYIAYFYGMISDVDNLIYYSMASLCEIALKNYKAPDKCPYSE